MKRKIPLAVGVLLAIAVLFIVGGKQPNEPATLQAVLSTVEGVGDVFIYYEQNDQTSFLMSQPAASKGVLVVCEGCQSQQLQLVIVETLSAVLQVPPHQIKVLPLMEGER